MHKRKGKGNGSGQHMYERLFNEQLKKHNACRTLLENCKLELDDSRGLAARLRDELIAEEAKAISGYKLELTEEELIVLADGDQGVSDMIADQVLALARARSII